MVFYLVNVYLIIKFGNVGHPNIELLVILVLISLVPYFSES